MFEVDSQYLGSRYPRYKMMQSNEMWLERLREDSRDGE